MRLGGQNCDLESKMSRMRWTILGCQTHATCQAESTNICKTPCWFLFYFFFCGEKKNYLYPETQLKDSNMWISLPNWERLQLENEVLLACLCFKKTKPPTKLCLVAKQPPVSIFAFFHTHPTLRIWIQPVLFFKLSDGNEEIALAYRMWFRKKKLYSFS